MVDSPVNHLGVKGREGGREGEREGVKEGGREGGEGIKASPDSVYTT